MLYRFKSQATADLIMLEDDGRTVLRLLGRQVIPEGVITLEQLPGAITALQAASHVLADGEPQGSEGIDSAGPSVGLAQRLSPVLRLLRLAQEAEKPVVWDATA